MDGKSIFPNDIRSSQKSAWTDDIPKILSDMIDNTCMVTLRKYWQMPLKIKLVDLQICIYKCQRGNSFKAYLGVSIIDFQ